MSVIYIENLVRDYGDGKGVFDLSFHVNQGEAFGFLGPNGAGKTTTIRHLMGFLKPKSGKCTIDGLDCWSERDKVQARLGYIPGEICFFDDMTGTEFLRFIAEYRKIDTQNRMKELLERFELDPKSKIKKMSKGMKQKLGIVAAFMHDPDILILDEPTASLSDSETEHLFHLIADLKEKGVSMVYISHRMNEILKIADAIERASFPLILIIPMPAFDIAVAIAAIVSDDITLPPDILNHTKSSVNQKLCPKYI